MNDLAARHFRFYTGAEEQDVDKTLVFENPVDGLNKAVISELPTDDNFDFVANITGVSANENIELDPFGEFTQFGLQAPNFDNFSRTDTVEIIEDFGLDISLEFTSDFWL